MKGEEKLMKKLSKKQKLVGFIAILLVAVILAIVITTNIIVNNHQSNQLASQEEYLATTANAGSSLVASYIKKGITIGGITGTLETLDTSDATATAEDIAYGKIAYARGERIVGTMGPIPNEDIQISATNVYYADLDSSGEISVDGVIFADLAGEEESGKWNGNSGSSYIIPSEAGLKQYYIKGEYTDEHFGTGKVIAPIEENDESKNDRFYVMALNNIDSRTHYWYNSAYGNLNSSYNVATSANDFAEAGAEPTGRLNTKRMIASWNSSQYGAQNSNDMWGLIQDEVADGWFVPSKSEWSAFGAAFGITSSNYSNTYGLSNDYWSSSQYTTDRAYSAYFYSGYFSGFGVYSSSYVRLATTF